MKITKTPAPYASAYRDALFRVTAGAQELVELDIYDHADQRIVGRRRFKGQTSYDVNVAGYARSQFDVLPLYAVECTFAKPAGRIVRTTVRSAEAQASALLCAGTRTLFEWDALSAAPTTVKIAPNESDEIAVLPGGSALTAQAVLRGSTQRSIELASQTPTDDLSVFCLKMSDLKAQVENDGNDSLDRYGSMEIRIASGDETVLAREYKFVPHYAGDVRLCWWNTFGQIDYYTMRRPLAEGFAIGKERVLTAEGYAVTASRRESRLWLVSDYENEKTMRSDFMDGAPFRSLYMSGRYPEQQTEPFKERMGFLAGRFGDATASADRFGRVYADPLTAVSSVGNLVDTADPDRTQDGATVAGVYNRNDCFREDGQRIAYCPVEEVTAGFEYSLAYRTDYRIASREELKCFDRVFLDDDVERRFRVVNRHEDRRTVFHGGWQYRLIVFGHQPGTEYRFSYRRIANPAADTADLQPGDYETVRLKTFSQRSVLIDVPADEQATEASLEFLSNGTYIPYEGDWALYDGYVAETGQIDIRLTIRSAAREIAPSSPRYFDRVYFGGADQGMNLTLGRRTTLKPIFLPHPCEGSTVRFADVAAHRVRQIDLIGALKQMFNLCFYSDALTGTLYIEPRDDFYRDDTVIDWSDRIDRSRPVTVEELGADLSKLFTLRYQEGDGTVARWDERNKQILGRWSTPILNRFASEGERVYANPLFTPTLNRTGAYPDAPDASLAQVGDRDRTGVPADTENLNFPPKIVRFLGVRTLPDTQRWGWPGYGNEYPEIAFHDPSGDEPFTLCFEDRDGVTGLHGGYDRSIEQYNSGRRITLYLRLNPEDIEPLISPNGLRRDFRALFKLAIEGETVMCRLEEISDYNPSAGSTRCVFLKET